MKLTKIIIIWLLLVICNQAFSIDIKNNLNTATLSNKHKKNISNIALKKHYSNHDDIVEKRLAKELQDVLASKLLNSMYEGVKPNSIFGGGQSEKMFQQLLNDERAKVLDLGLIPHIEDKIKSVNSVRGKNDGRTKVIK